MRLEGTGRDKAWSRLGSEATTSRAICMLATEPHVSVPRCNLAPADHSEDDKLSQFPPGRLPADHGLPYTVELWDEAKASIELVLAISAHSSIGYAAYYAATLEYPDRLITLRHKNRIISRSLRAGH
jgi:hypothetical protein